MSEGCEAREARKARKVEADSVPDPLPSSIVPALNAVRSVAVGHFLQSPPAVTRSRSLALSPVPIGFESLQQYDFRNKKICLPVRLPVCPAPRRRSMPTPTCSNRDRPNRSFAVRRNQSHAWCLSEPQKRSRLRFRHKDSS